MTVLTWIANSTGFWSDAANRNPAQVPLAADSVVFDGTGTGASFLSGNTVASLSLTSASALVTILGSLSVTGTTSLAAGSLAVSNNATATLNNLSNQGTITLGSSGSITLTGSYTTPDLNRISRSGGSLYLGGLLNNVGQAYGIPTNLVTGTTITGTILGGTITNGFSIGGTLDGVTWRGTLAPALIGLSIQNGLTVQNSDGSGPGTILLGGFSKLTFLGDQILDNVLVSAGNNPDLGQFLTTGTLTLGPSSDFRAGGRPLSSGAFRIEIGGTSASGAIINQGTIETAPDPGSPPVGIHGTGGAIFVTIDAPTFLNVGTLLASSTDYNSVGITIQSGQFTNQASGVITILPGANVSSASITVDAATNFVNNGSVLVSAGSLAINAALHGTGVITVRDNGRLTATQVVDAGETIALNTTGTATLDQPSLFNGLITGLTQGTFLDLGVAATAVSYDNGHLVMQYAGGATFTLAIAGNLTLADFSVNTGTASTSITTDLPAPCFAAGTRIATLAGERAVEDLRVGDLVRIAGTRQTRPVVWVGHRRVDCRRHPDPDAVNPVRVARHAFGASQPSRDLFLSPDHAIFAGGVLIPVRRLVNGHSVMQVPVRSVDYYHVELDRHDIMLADGLAVESYLDTGDRDCFGDAGDAIRLFPVFGAGAGASLIQEAKGRAPLAIAGHVVEMVRQQLDRRAA